MAIVPLVLFILLKLFVDVNNYSEVIIVYPGIAVTILILYIYLFHRFKLFQTSVRLEYQNCQDISSDLSDMIDWGKMRKCQQHTPLDPKLQKTLDVFFHFCLSWKCPFYGGRHIYKRIYMFAFSSCLGFALYCVIQLVFVCVGLVVKMV